MTILAYYIPLFPTLEFYMSQKLLRSLFFSNDKNVKNIYIEKTETPAVPCDSYHPAFEIMVKVSPILDCSHNYFDFHRASYTKICEFLDSFNWLETIISLDVDRATEALYDALHFRTLNFIPEVSYVPSTFPK